MDYYCLSYGEFCLNHSHLHSTVTKTLLDFVRRLRCCLEGHRIFAVFPFAFCNSRPFPPPHIWTQEAADGGSRRRRARRFDGDCTSPSPIPVHRSTSIACICSCRTRTAAAIAFSPPLRDRIVASRRTASPTAYDGCARVASSFANGRRATMQQKQPSQKVGIATDLARLYVPCDCEGLAGCHTQNGK